MFMIMLISPNSNLITRNIQKILLRFFTTGIVTATGFFGILFLEVNPSLDWLLSTAQAQNFTENEVTSYARAGYEVELLRQRVYKEIKSMLNEAPPDIVCNQPNTFADLPGDVRATVDRYCDDSLNIVQSHNLSIDRFNQLKRFYDGGGKFYQQVQDALKELQLR